MAHAPSSSTPPVVTRFAPSPTGHLHIGGARTALFCWAFARRYHGHFVLRIEDTDQARSSDESARGIMEDLAWLGIEWDEGPELTLPSGRRIGGDPRGVGPFFQARRVDHYNAFMRKLVEEGKAYPAFESSEELEAERRKAVAAKQTYRYNRASYDKVSSIAERLRRMDSGEPHVIRLLAPHEPIVVHDQVLGDVNIAAGELDDFVIRKADGLPTYHFAVVIDDQLMGVTHVLRAQEHLANTPRHVALQKALGFRTPIYGHMPLIFNMDSTKMSKRDKAKVARANLVERMKKDASITAESVAGLIGLPTAEVAGFIAKDNDSLAVATGIARVYGLTLPEVEVADFRENGYLAGAICNFVSLLGWNPGHKTPDGKDLEKFGNAFLAEHFSLERIGRTNAKFDRAKLLSFNADAIAGMADEAFVAAWRAWCREFMPELAARLDEAAMLLLAKVVKPRAKTLKDAVKAVDFVLRDDASGQFDGTAVEKNLRAADGAGLKMLREFRPVLAGLGEWTAAAIHAAMEEFAKARGNVSEKGVNVGPIAQPLRVAVAGVAVTPPVGETLAALGRDSTLARIDRCLQVCGAM